MVATGSGVIVETERILAERFGRKRAFLVGRGATGLMLLYESLLEPDGKVILPALGCSSLLATVLLTGRRPVIVDVDRNLSIDPEEVAKAVQPGDIVLGVHLFGIPCAVDELSAICAARNAIFVEDAAQAVGGRINGRPLGSFGSASLLSFAQGKILPTTGGGAILTDDDKLIGILEQKVADLPERPADIIRKGRDLRDELTARFNEARGGNPAAASAWGGLYNRFGPIYSFAIDEGEARIIARALSHMDDIAKNRREKTERYRKLLSPLNLWIPEYTDECVPFRFSFVAADLTESEVQKLTQELREAGLDASNLYMSLAYMAPERIENRGCETADLAGWHIINLWVDDSVNKPEILTAVDVVREFLSQ